MSKKKPLWVAHHTFEYNPLTHTEQCGGLSDTQPGMALTIPEVIARTQEGQVIPDMEFNLQYGESDNLNPMYKPGLDLTDLDNIKQDVQEVQDIVDKARERKEQKEEQDKLDLLVEQARTEIEKGESKHDVKEV